ncbi:MAG: AI-2E family transporter [Deltaproteobacteria bacterium]|nr:MAG: AI-2E family transporter [Deltaproteobacteria bacterium]
MDDEPQRSLEAEQRSLTTTAILITAAIALGAALTVLRDVAIPFVIALLLVYVVDPLVDYLEMRLRAPRWLALVVTMIIGAGVFVGLVALIVSSVDGIEQKLDVYAQRLVAFEQSIVDWLQGLGLDIDNDAIVQHIQALPKQEIATEALGSLAAILSKAALVLLFFAFIILGKSPWDDKGGVWNEIDKSVHRYLRTKLITSTAIGLVFGGILFGFGIDLALVFGLLAFLLNFIPTIGSVLAILSTLPLIFVAVDPLVGLGIVGGLVLAQNIIGNILEPKLMGAGLDLHPATILIGLGLWGVIWGVVGMLLSAPLMAIIRVVLKNYAPTRPFAELLAGRVGSQARRSSLSL